MEASVATEQSNVDQVIQMVKGLTVLELAQLVKALEKEFGVSAAPQVVASAAPVGGGQAAEEAAPTKAESTEFDVILQTIGDNKIQVIKEARAILNLGLKEAKAVVDGAPGPIKQKATKEEAQELKTKLEAVGATVEIKGL